MKSVTSHDLYPPLSQTVTLSQTPPPSGAWHTLWTAPLWVSLTNMDSAKRDSAKRDSAKQDSANRDSAKRDSAKRNSVKRDSAKRNSAKRDSVKRVSAKRDSAKREGTQQINIAIVHKWCNVILLIFDHFPSSQNVTKCQTLWIWCHKASYLHKKPYFGQRWNAWSAETGMAEMPKMLRKNFQMS